MNDQQPNQQDPLEKIAAHIGGVAEAIMFLALILFIHGCMTTCAPRH